MSPKIPGSILTMKNKKIGYETVTKDVISPNYLYQFSLTFREIWILVTQTRVQNYRK